MSQRDPFSFPFFLSFSMLQHAPAVNAMLQLILFRLFFVELTSREIKSEKQLKSMTTNNFEIFSKFLKRLYSILSTSIFLKKNC